MYYTHNLYYECSFFYELIQIHPMIYIHLVRTRINVYNIILCMSPRKRTNKPFWFNECFRVNVQTALPKIWKSSPSNPSKQHQCSIIYVRYDIKTRERNNNKRPFKKKHKKNTQQIHKNTHNTQTTQGGRARVPPTK